MARSFWVENRRTSNQLLRSLGYRLIHPSYREGFRASLAEERRQVPDALAAQLPAGPSA
jgi:hypothetical protein